MALTPGSRLGVYAVTELLGKGGMGEVYRARDTKLERDVAIKVLPQETASDRERLRRLEQEARAASALNHPNIVTIYEIGEHEGFPYIAMEYVDGTTLRELLADGPLEDDELLRYAVQLAEGLAKAHQAGIVHRDLKPENIVISDDGYVKILDFGLAKFAPEHDVGAEAATVTKQTAPGAILGTLGYMSPEQAKGESADFRADQFSVGAVLYEMATGRRAFEREAPAETLAAIMRDEPDPITIQNPGVPGELILIIKRCLEKDPAERYESSLTLVRELDRLNVPAAAVPSPSRSVLFSALAGVGLLAMLVALAALLMGDVPDWFARDHERIESIAVLPIQNASGDPEQEYLADGMTDALINELAQIHALRVISRTSVMQYKDTRRSLPEIGRELDVDVLLEGSVLRSGNRIGLTTQLMDARADDPVWSGSYERELEDVLVLRKEVARAIVDEIRIVVTPEERNVLDAAPPVNAEAYDAYQKGLFFQLKFTETSIREAIDYAQQSIEHDPSFAPAHALLAAAYSTLTYVAREAPGTLAVNARDAALKSLSLDENLGDAHATLAWIRATYDWDWAAADASYRRAIELTPGFAGASGAYSHFLAAMGRFDESLRYARLSQRLDPASANEAENLAFVLYMARRFDQCIAEARSGLELHPDHMYLHVRLARALVENGELDDAIATAIEADRLAGGDPDRRALLGRLYAIAGRHDEARAILAELEGASEQGYIPPTAIARIYVGLEDYEKALDLLEQAYEVRDGDMYLLKAWPVWDPLRDDPRFQDLLSSMRFPD